VAACGHFSDAEKNRLFMKNSPYFNQVRPAVLQAALTKGRSLYPEYFSTILKDREGWEK
jgi:hypothetical protein